MNAAGYRNFQSFSKCQYFKIGSRLWMIKVFGKNAFYKLFTNMLRPFSALNYSFSNNQINENDEEDNKFMYEFISLPFSSFVSKQIREIQLTQKINRKTKPTLNPFAPKEGLDGLRKENREDSGIFGGIKDKVSFVHSLQLVNNPMAMDEFCLDEVETVMSEYDMEECNSFLQESMVISSMDSLYDSTTDTSVY